MFVDYTDKRGWKQLREVPDGLLTTDDYSKGILVGPPDCSSLPLSSEKQRLLNNLLFEAGMVEYANIKGRRRELLDIVQRLTGGRDTDLLKHIIALYQHQFYED